MRNRFTKFTILTIVSFLILISLLSLLRSNPRPEPIHDMGSVQLHSSRIIGRNILFPSLLNNQSIRFFTGSAFAEFNINTFTTKSISKEFALPAVDQVRWNGNQALIEVERTTPYDDLYKLASKEARAAPSWWIVNLVNSDIRQVNTIGSGYDVVSAVWGSDGSIYVLGEKMTSSDEVIEQQSPASKLMASSKTSHLLLIGSTANGLVVQDSHKALLVWNNRKFSTIISGPAKNILIGGGRYLFHSDANGNILEYDTWTPSHLTRLVDAANRPNNFSAFQNGLLILPTPQELPPQPILSGALLLNSSAGIDKYNLYINSGDSTMVGNINTALKLSSTDSKIFNFVVTNKNNDLFLLSTDPLVSQKSTPYPLVILPGNSVPLVNASTAYDTLYNHLYIYFQVNGDAETLRNQVLQQLRGYGDPNQVYKTWQAASP